MWPGMCVTSRTGSVGWDFEKSQWVESCRPKKKGVFRLLAEALWWVPHVLGGADGKASIERLCLSPYVEKPFNSKEIKSFVPELRSRKCFSCFGIPMLCYIWTFYEHYMYVSHISISDYVTTAVLWGVASRICSKRHTLYFCEVPT